MRTTVDAAGRLVIPKQVREAVGIRPGMEVDIRAANGRIEIERVTPPVELVREGRWLVAIATAGEPLPDGLVERTIDALREERFSQITGL